MGSKRRWYFTFGQSHVDRQGNSLRDIYVAVEADDRFAARRQMTEARGDKWAFDYPNKLDAGIYKYDLKEKRLNEVALDG